MSDFTATRSFMCLEDDAEITVRVRWEYSITPGCAQTYTQPAEDAEVSIDSIKVSWGRPEWSFNPAIVDLATEVFGGDDTVEEWLMEQAVEQAAWRDDDHADHKRDLAMNDAFPPQPAMQEAAE